MGIPDHLTCLLRNLYAGQEATVRTGHGITDWFQIGKEVCQGCISSPCLFNLYTEYIMRNPRLDKVQTGIKIAGRNVNQFSSVQFSCLVLSNSLRPHGLQHARPPCPTPTPRVYPNSCPLSRRCHPVISSSVIPFSSRLQYFPASGSLQMSQFFASASQSIGGSEVKASACKVGDLGSIPGLGRSPGEGNGNPLQYGLQSVRHD